MRWLRWLFIWGAPVAIAFHVAVSRAEHGVVRGAGLGIVIVYLLLYTYLAHVKCPHCGEPYFGSWRGSLYLPWTLFRRRPACGSCGERV
jgi:hypothetical protein